MQTTAGPGELFEYFSNKPHKDGPKICSAILIPYCYQFPTMFSYNFLCNILYAVPVAERGISSMQ